MNFRCCNPAVAFALLLLCGLQLGCAHDPQPVQRPQSVPPTAVWAGGADGGAYIECSHGSGAVNNCTVYNDGDGSIWYSGRFILAGKNRPASASELRYRFADGDKIYLQKNLVLRPIK